MADQKLEVLIQAKDQASATLKQIEKQVGLSAAQIRRVGIGMVAVGGAMAAAFGFATKAAAEEEAGIQRLSQSLANVGLTYDLVRGSLEQWIDTQQQQTAFADSEQRESLSQLVLATGDLTQAQGMLRLSMDMSRGMGIDLASATQKVQMAMSGNWGMLQRYIPTLSEAKTEEEKWFMLRQMFAGQAEKYTQTLKGQMEVLKNNISDIQETIGGFIANALAPLAIKINEIVNGIKAWTSEHPKLTETLTISGVAISGLLLALGSIAIFLPQIIKGISILVTAIKWLAGIVVAINPLMALLAAGIALIVAGVIMLTRKTDDLNKEMERQQKLLAQATKDWASYQEQEAIRIRQKEEAIEKWKEENEEKQRGIRIEREMTMAMAAVDAIEVQRARREEITRFAEQQGLSLATAESVLLGQYQASRGVGGEFGGPANQIFIVNLVLDGEILARQVIDRLTGQVVNQGGVA